jgi:hypothetical protein
VAGNLKRLLDDVRSVYLLSVEAAPAGESGGLIPYSGLVDPPAVGRADEELIASVMALLRDVAGIAERTSTLKPPPSGVVYGVLSSSELIMRWECLAGRREEVLGHLHGFTYLATIFFLDRELALRRSDEVRALVEAAGYEAR